MVVTSGGGGQSGGGAAPCAHSPAPFTGAAFAVTGGAPSHLVYDPVHNLVFATNPPLNEVDVVSASSHRLVARIPAPQPVGIDILPDSTAVVVGSAVQSVELIDPVGLRVTRRIAVPAAMLAAPSSSVPAFPIVTAQGKVLLLCVGPQSLESLSPPYNVNQLLEWDPASGVFTNRSALLPAAGLSTAAARSGDHTKIVFGTEGTPGGLYLYNSSTDNLSQLGPTITANIMATAANAGGTQFAVLTYGGDGVDFIDADGTLHPLEGGGVPLGGTIAYSADGSHLYTENQEKLAGQETLTVIDASDYTFQSEFDAGHEALVQAATPGGWIVANGPAGILFAPEQAPAVQDQSEMALSYPVVSPGNGAANSIGGQGFGTGDQVYFGSAAACSPQIASENQIQVTAPQGGSPGPVNVTVTSPNGWFEIAADGYSYGPFVQTLDPSAGPAQGGNELTIYGFGLNYPASDLQVSFGGAEAAVGSVSAYNPGNFLGLDRVEVSVPAGAPGWADVTVTTPDGSFVLPHGYQYLQAASLIPGPAGLATLLLDSGRQELFATAAAGNQVQVFPLGGNQFAAPIALANTAATDVLSALDLTPDDSELIAGDESASAVEILDPDQPAVQTAVSTACGSSSYNCAPLELAATSTGEVFIATAYRLEKLDLATLTIAQQNAPPLTDFPPQLLARTRDGSEVFFDAEFTAGLWSAATGQFTTAPQMLSQADNAAISADGTQIEEDGGDIPILLDSSLTTDGALVNPDYVNGYAPVRGAAFGPTGALVFVPTPQTVDIFDSHSGQLRLRIALPEALTQSFPARPMALGADGQTIYLAGQKDLEILRLAALPLAIGAVTPDTAAASGGTQMQITGTGFTAQTAVSINGVKVNASLVSPATLRFTAPASAAGPAQITLHNADGESEALDDAFQFQ